MEDDVVAAPLGFTKALLSAANRFIPARTASTFASVEEDGEVCGAGEAEEEVVVVATGFKELAATAVTASDDDKVDDALLFSMMTTGN